METKMALPSNCVDCPLINNCATAINGLNVSADTLANAIQSTQDTLQQPNIRQLERDITLDHTKQIARWRNATPLSPGSTHYANTEQAVRSELEAHAAVFRAEHGIPDAHILEGLKLSYNDTQIALGSLNTFRIRAMGCAGPTEKRIGLRRKSQLECNAPVPLGVKTAAEQAVAKFFSK